MDTNSKTANQLERCSRLIGFLNDPTTKGVFKPSTPVIAQTRHAQLVKYFTTWIAAGCNFDDWTQREEFCKRQFDQHPVWTAEDGRPVMRTVQFQGVYEDYKRLDVPLRRQRSPRLTDEEIDDILRETDEEKGAAQAASAFSDFLLSDFDNAVGQCGYPPCGRFYLMTSGHKGRKYCSTKCARKDTAVKATAERNARVYALKVDAIQMASVDFKRLPASKQARIEETEGWTPWIARRANARLRGRAPEVTPAFITRAANSGKLLPVKDTK
jgi:hypothetical protein